MGSGSARGNMAEVINKRRWITPLLIVTAVVAISVAIIVLYHKTTGALSVHAVSDGAGGAIVAWQNNDGIRTQRISASGQPLWREGGLLVQKIATEFNSRAFPGLTLFTLTADGAGGAIVTWQDRSTYPGPLDGPPIDVYSQRISASGDLLWGDGVKTGKVDPISQDVVWVVPNGTGGAIFGWDDYKTALHDDFLRLQKVNPDGRLLWGDNGVLVTASSPFRGLTEEEKARGMQGTASRSWPTYTGYQRVVSDGEQGAIVIWYEEDYPNRTYLVYARRVDAQGDFAWAKPIMLATTKDNPNFSGIYDGTGGSEGLVALAIPGAGGGGLTTFMCFDRDGKILWQKSMPAGMNYSTDMVSDGLGGIIVSRYEYSPPFHAPREQVISLYLQRLDSEGNAVWTERPVVTTQTGQSLATDMVADTTGGAMLVWRLGQTENDAYGKLFALGLNAEGNASWGEGGLPIFPDAKLKYQGTPKIVIADPSGAIVVAALGRSALRGDIVYAQKLDTDGNRLWGNGIRIDQQRAR